MTTRGVTRSGPGTGRSSRQELLVETTDLAFAIDEVDFEDPVPLVAIPVRAAQGLVVARGDVGPDLLAGYALMRKLPDEMSGDRAAVGPTQVRGVFLHERE